MQIFTQFQRAQVDPTRNPEERAGNSHLNDGKHCRITFTRIEAVGLGTQSATFCAIRKERKIGGARPHCQLYKT